MATIIAIDAMGGDNAPNVVIEGAVRAARKANHQLQILLVGPEDTLAPLLAAYQEEHLPIAILHAPEVIGMDESPAVALRAKPQSSIHVGIQAHKMGKANAFVSVGNTGAIMAAALFLLGRLPNIARPALPAYFPTLQGTTIVLDVGANVDCKPEHLLQFARMGSVFYRVHLKKEQPTVGLLNIGEEPSKGNELTKNAYPLFEQTADLTFVGNVEGRDIMFHKADVVVCDGFIGNVLLKYGESMPRIFQRLIQEVVQKRRLSPQEQQLIFSVLSDVHHRFDYEEFGGVPLLGINGNILIGHGSSSPRAIEQLILQGAKIAEENIIGQLSEAFQNAS